MKLDHLLTSLVTISSLELTVNQYVLLASVQTCDSCSYVETRRIDLCHILYILATIVYVNHAFHLEASDNKVTEMLDV